MSLFAPFRCERAERCSTMGLLDYSFPCSFQVWRSREMKHYGFVRLCVYLLLSRVKEERDETLWVCWFMFPLSFQVWRSREMRRCGFGGTILRTTLTPGWFFSLSSTRVSILCSTLFSQGQCNKQVVGLWQSHSLLCKTAQQFNNTKYQMGFQAVKPI